MAAVTTLQSSPISAFNLNNLKWVHIEGGPEFDYPINYWLAILGAKPEAGCLDFLVKWEPDSYCHFHRHIGDTTTLILEGEHHVVERMARKNQILEDSLEFRDAANVVGHFAFLGFPYGAYCAVSPPCAVDEQGFAMLSHGNCLVELLVQFKNAVSTL